MYKVKRLEKDEKKKEWKKKKGTFASYNFQMTCLKTHLRSGFQLGYIWTPCMDPFGWHLTFALDTSIKSSTILEKCYLFGAYKGMEVE